MKLKYKIINQKDLYSGFFKLKKIEFIIPMIFNRTFPKYFPKTIPKQGLNDKKIDANLE